MAQGSYGSERPHIIRGKIRARAVGLSPEHKAKVLGKVGTLVRQGSSSSATVPVMLVSWIAKRSDKATRRVLGIRKTGSLDIVEEHWPSLTWHQHSGTRQGSLSEERGDSRSKPGTTLGRLDKDKVTPK